MIDFLLNILLNILPLRDIEYKEERIELQYSIQELNIENYNKYINYYNKFNSIKITNSIDIINP